MKVGDKADSFGEVVAQILLTGACVGLAAGLLEAATLNLLRLWPKRMAWQLLARNVSIEFVYLAPLFYVLLFFTVALLLVGLAHVTRRFVRLAPVPFLHIALFVMLWMACYAVLSVPHRFSELAIWSVSAGIAFQLVRWSAQSHHAVLRYQPRCFACLAVILLVIASGITAWSYARETQLNKALPPARPGAPNVLLIVLDTVAAQHLSTYGYHRDTSPNLTEFADEGVLFENAIAPSSWTPATHGTLFTGLLPGDHGATNPRPMLREESQTLAEVAQKHGYATAGFSANTLWATRNVNLDQGFIHFEDYFDNLQDVISRTVFGQVLHRHVLRPLGYRNQLGRKLAASVTDRALGWIDTNRERPFFVFLNYFDAHTPYISPEPFHARFMSPQVKALESSDPMAPPIVAKEVPTQQQDQLWIAAYDGAIAYADSQLGVLFSGLRRRGVLDNTLVIVTSDHGEAFGEHGFYQHGWGLHREVLRVPLIVRWPGKVPSGFRVQPPVGLADVPATIEDLAFFGTRRAFPGTSLEVFWETDPATAEQKPEFHLVSTLFSRGGLSPKMPAGQGWVYSLFTPQWHLLLQENGNVELYDWRNDPAERNNLGHTPLGAPLVERLQLRLQEMLAQHRASQIYVQTPVRPEGKTVEPASIRSHRPRKVEGESAK